MMHAQPFRELSPRQVKSLRAQYDVHRESLTSNFYQKHVCLDSEVHPLPNAWDGKGEIPLITGNSGIHCSTSFLRHTVSADEWSLRVDMAATCRLVSRLNGHTTYEGTFAHFSYDLGDGTYLVAPADVPFSAMRASFLLVTDADGKVLRGEGLVDPVRFRAFNRMRNEPPRKYPALLMTHTTFTDRLAQHDQKIRMVSQVPSPQLRPRPPTHLPLDPLALYEVPECPASDNHSLVQSAFNFADDAYGYFDAWGHNLGVDEEPTDELVEHVKEHDKVFVMLSHGGVIARGESPAHVFALVHGVDAAAEIQVYAEMTGFPLMEIDREKVRSFPRHGYGDMREQTKRMVQSFAANKRLLLCDWNQGFRNTGDSSFVL